MSTNENELPTTGPLVQVLPMSDREQRGMDELPGLEAACTAGDLDAVHVLHSRWLARTPPDPATGFVVRPWLWGAVDRAIENDHAKVLTYFFSNGYHVCPIERGASSHIARAVEVRSTACLQAFLERGWNINERTDPLYPAALR